jgi:DNA-binding GntR family transcriptional regulator
VERLRKLCSDYDAAVDAYEASGEPTIPAKLLDKTFRADNEFHATILRAARNENAVKIVENFSLITSIALAATRRKAMRPCWLGNIESRSCGRRR